MFSFKLLSRFNKVTIDGTAYYTIPQIFAIRFKVHNFVAPRAIKVLNNGEVVSQQILTSSKNNLNNYNYYNIWINAFNIDSEKNILQIYLNYFGIYLPVCKFNFIPLPNDRKNLYHLSDGYIEIEEISNSDYNKINLDTQINNLDSTIRLSTIPSNASNSINNIILLRLDQLGDFVLSLSAIQEIKILFPNAQITILVSPSNAAFAQSLGLFDRVVSINFSFEANSNVRTLSNSAKDQVKLATQKFSYDLAIDLSPMPESRELLAIINAEKKFGFENTDTFMLDAGILVHAKDPINQLSNVNHSAYPLVLIDLVKRVLKPQAFHLSNKNVNAKILHDFNLNDKEYIIIHSGARNLLVRWPIDKFIELAKTIIQNDIYIVFFSDEKLSIEHKQTLNQFSNIIVIDQRIDFSDFDTLISNSMLFIGNDSGPKHLAAMRSIETVSIHSPRTNWSEWGQVDSGCIISRRVPCAGCAIVSKEECARELECIKEIKVSEVTKALSNFDPFKSKLR
jgi:ADP-heptose:LPS heptosyltransferase